MIFEQRYLACLSHASYLIGDERTRTAVIVDPQRDVDVHLEDAQKHGLAIRHVFLTHFHADFVSGHLELFERCGATIHLGARARAEYAVEPAHEGDRLELGNVRLEVLETPGHTPESISILVYDLARDARAPWAVLTGDTLFVGDVGRPDLLASVGLTADELAGMLYDSLHGKLLRLPDATRVYPAHGAGSMCGKNLGPETWSTIGAQRAHNEALQPRSREEFVQRLTACLPEAPGYFAYDAELNRRERPTLERALEKSLRPISLAEALRHKDDGAVLLDVRDPAEYAREHLRGSTNIGLGGRFASWAGTLLDPLRPIVVIAKPNREREALLRLGRIGFDHAVGYLEGGAAAFAGRAELVASHRRIDARALEEGLGSGDPPLVLDVRTKAEWTAQRIEGSLNLPLQELEAGVGVLPRDRRIAVHCQTGYRSSIAVGLLEQHGFADLEELDGGIVMWQTSRSGAAPADSCPPSS